MIELNIPINAAVLLLLERMQNEFEVRARKGNYTGMVMTDLEAPELQQLAEIAAFDLIFMLPAEIFEEENNLCEVVTKTMKGIAEKFGKKMFENYSEEDAARLIRPIKQLFYYSNKVKSHIHN